MSDVTEKATISQTIYEVTALVITGVGLTLEPGVFLACITFASLGSIVAKNHMEMARTRRGFWLTLMTGLFFSLAMLLLDQSLSQAYTWWPNLAPQLVAIGGGFFSPIAVPLMLRMFPRVADRLVGKYLPEDKPK